MLSGMTIVMSVMAGGLALVCFVLWVESLPFNH